VFRGFSHLIGKTDAIFAPGNYTWEGKPCYAQPSLSRSQSRAVSTNAFLQRASAEVKRGDLITYQNADKVRDLVWPGTLYKVNQ
jgi:hypothetical protein